MDRSTMFSDDAKTTTGLINDDDTKHTYQVLGDMIAKGFSPDASIMQSLGTQGAEDLFRQGKLGMAIGDFSQVSALEEAGINYGIATLPVEKAGDPPYLPTWTDGLAVFSDSPHPDAAKQFLAFLATDGQQLRVDVTGEPPLNSAVAAESGWVDQGNSEARKQFLEAIKVSKPAMFVPGFWDVTAPLQDQFNLIAAGEVSASDALDEVAPRMQDTLDQSWVTWNEIVGS
jgi:ABC-type glycerol-3-phosphate transport system substrate-binding protein